jgi:RNA polymerase sigma-70 factor (ECF subfamily)
MKHRNTGLIGAPGALFLFGEKTREFYRGGKTNHLAVGGKMVTTIHHANLTAFGTFLPPVERTAEYQAFFQQHSRRLYSLAFWMTDNELAAEDLMRDTFQRAFAGNPELDGNCLDRALVTELRTRCPLGVLSLNEPVSSSVSSIRRNTLRVHLERAVVQIPPTERLIFLLHDVEGCDHARIARLLGMTQNESRLGLHQARLRIRRLIAAMPR